MGSGTCGKYGETVGLGAAEVRAGEIGSTLEHVYPKKGDGALLLRLSDIKDRGKADSSRSGVRTAIGADKSNLSLLEKNAQAMEGKFAMNEYGDFGKKGRNSRVIEGDDPIRDSKAFYSQLSKGGAEESLVPSSKGVKSLMPNGSTITYRVVTKTPNSSAVDIRILGRSSVNTQKVYFERGV